MKKSVAAFLIDGFLFGKSNLPDETKDRVIVYLTGATRNRGLFSASDESPKPDLNLDRQQLLALRTYLDDPLFRGLLSKEQISGVKERAEGLM